MNVTHDIVGTLRANMGGHPPIVLMEKANEIQRNNSRSSNTEN